MTLPPPETRRSPLTALASAVAVYASVRVAVVLLLGFSAGLPLALSGETLRVWMADRGVDLGTIGLICAREPALHASSSSGRRWSMRCTCRGCRRGSGAGAAGSSPRSSR